MWWIIVPVVIVAGKWWFDKQWETTPLGPGPFAPSQRPAAQPSSLPFGFTVGDRVLVDPALFFNPNFPIPGQDTRTAVLCVVVDPKGAFLTPFGVPSISVSSKDNRVNDSGIDHIVPIAAVKKL